MTRKQTMRLLTMLLVCIILLNFISQPKAEAIGGSLALALGGISAAKAFLAFIMSCIAMGVTYSTYDQAKAAYDHYTENATMSTEDLRYIQQETWTGNYEGITSDISDMKDSFVGWLTGLFGTLQSGNVTSQTSNVYYNGTSTVTVPMHGNGTYFAVLKHDNKFYYVETIYTYASEGTSSIEVYINGQLAHQDAITPKPNNWEVEINKSTYITFRVYINGKYYSNYNKTFGSGEGVLDEPIIEQSISAVITTDAPILNPSYTPQNRTFPAAPYLPYIDFDNEKVGQSISAAGGTMEVYNGTYDQYLDDIVENATWEDIQGISAGTVPTTTLTETSEGLIIGEATTGIPYPIPDTTAPGEVLTGLGGIIGLLQGITNWIAQLWQLISGIFAIPEGLALDFSSLRLEGFKDKFPFSIPWDIYRAVAVFAKTPETPEFNIDIETDYLDINHSINLDPIDLPLRFARYVMSIFFIFFLASKTRDLIKW